MTITKMYQLLWISQALKRILMFIALLIEALKELIKAFINFKNKREFQFIEI
jgi:hypothetical protein